MECPKCRNIISDKERVCPHCRKVLVLECPNCGSVSDTPVCEACGYTILVKCSKCSKLVNVSSDKCKCGFPVSTSLAYQECETDDFASVAIRFFGMKNIRRLLGSKDLYSKFYTKLTNLLAAQFKGIDGKIIKYKDYWAVNFNKELSFPTSSDKALRFGLKIINAFSALNLNITKELAASLKLTVAVTKKSAEDLQKETDFESNVRLLNIKKDAKKYLKGMQIILDQYVWDNVNKNYKTDSLYSAEKNGKTVMFYEVLLENYVLPPAEKSGDKPLQAKQTAVKKIRNSEENEDIYSFKVFNINADCSFKKVSAGNLFDTFDNNKIISLRAVPELGINTADLTKYYESKGKKVLHAVCTEELNYKPWGFFEQLFRDYYGLSFYNPLIPANFEVKHFAPLLDLLRGNARKAASPEDARFAYIEDFGNFLASLKNCVILTEGFEYMDDTSIQTLEIFFERFKNFNPDFVFVTDNKVSLHSKFKSLLRTPLYTEYVLEKTETDSFAAAIKEDASDLIKSFYFEKISELYDGSLLYLDNALRYLTEKGVLINFDGKLLIQNTDTVMLPNGLTNLLKARLKFLNGKGEPSMILAYAVFLGARLDFEVLSLLGIKDIEAQAKILEDAGFVRINGNIIYVNNYNIIKPIIQNTLKKEAAVFVCKNIVSKLGKNLDNSVLLQTAENLLPPKEQYTILRANSIFAMKTGDYNAYLKNCLKFLELIEKSGVSREDEEACKKEVFQNILMSLYAYSPEKIYSIEKILLSDALDNNDNEAVVKISNLMLQGALLSSNYTDAQALLHNILTRIPNPVLFVDGALNTRFLLLSLVNMEILFNIGDFAGCIEVSNELLKAGKPEILDKIKPPNFSTGLFITHMLETFKLAGFAKLFRADDDFEEFFAEVSSAFNTELPDKDAIIAVRDFLNGKDYAPAQSEDVSAFSKVIYLILQEFSQHFCDIKTFAQNIYQAKLLASDIKAYQIELFCDLLIAYSYADTGIPQKAESIYNDVLQKSEKSAVFNTMTLAEYFIARLKISRSEPQKALLIINDMLALLQKHDNKIIYVLFEKLFIDLVKAENIASVNLAGEEANLALALSGGKFARLVEQT